MQVRYFRSFIDIDSGHFGARLLVVLQTLLQHSAVTMHVVCKCMSGITYVMVHSYICSYTRLAARPNSLAMMRS